MRGRSGGGRYPRDHLLSHIPQESFEELKAKMSSRRHLKLEDAKKLGNLVAHKDFKYTYSKSNMIGKGSFGAVYQGWSKVFLYQNIPTLQPLIFYF